MNVTILTASILILAKVEVRAYEMHLPLFNRRPLGLTNMLPLKHLALQHLTMVHKKCYSNNMITECPIYPKEFTNVETVTGVDKTIQHLMQNHYQTSSNLEYAKNAQTISNMDNVSPFRRMVDQITNSSILSPLHGKLEGYKNQYIGRTASSNKLNMKLEDTPKQDEVQITTISFNDHSSTTPSAEKVTTVFPNLPNSTNSSLKPNKMILVKPGEQILDKFSHSLDSFERKFYATTFSKLSSISPPARRENGMSYVQSGLFLYLALMALSTEVGSESRRQIDDSLGLDISDQERVDLINATVSSLPQSNDDLKFRWSSRLVLFSQNVTKRFRSHAAAAMRLQIDAFNETETPKKMAEALNQMVEMDSGGAIHNTFEEDELSADVRVVLVSTLYLRARWRSAPTLLNGTMPFRDADDAPLRTTRMIRLNDVMRYADLVDWNAEALEIPYSTAGLSLLMLIPRNNSLRRLVDATVSTSLSDVTAVMKPLRVAASLPLYTLRMTLLLPNKLQAMNMSRLVESNNGTESEFSLSLAVQRIMFWAEAGRNAYKDDGLEWDEAPEKEVVVDRPYIFYVRWKNKTIMNGNFVL